jgi:predicted membrane protein
VEKMSQRLIRRNIPLILTFITGMIVTIDWFVRWDPLQTLTAGIMNFQIVMTAFMMGFAGVNLIINHTRRIQRNMRQNSYIDVLASVCLLAGLFIWTLVGIGLGDQSSQYKWLYTSFNLPLSSTAYAATLFYLASATYRVLRVRSTETAILLGISLFVIAGNMPLFVTWWNGFQVGKTWISDILVNASYRAITIGVGLGGVLMGVRTLLAMETGYLGRAIED